MKFTTVEKSAIIKVLADIMFADGKIDLGEKAYLGQIFQTLKISTNDTSLSMSLKVSEGIAILGQMSNNKKEALVIMMTEMINADNEIQQKELEIFNVVFASIGLVLPKNV